MARGRALLLAALTTLLTVAGTNGSMSARAGAKTFYRPAQHTDWMWEIGARLHTDNPTQMGTGITAWNGDTSPGDDPALYDIDAIQNPASTVSTLHTLGDHAICYLEVGTAGNYYSAADEGIPTTYYAQLKAAGDLGRKLSGYPEYFIDITAPSAVAIVEAMIDQQCAAKGFDAVETDLDETFDHNEGNPGFTITQADEESYLRTLAIHMHGDGLGWIAKNLDDTGVASFVTHMQRYAQGMISEQCNQYHTCSLLAPFLAAGKWIGNAEYAPETPGEFCAADNAADMNGIRFKVDLAGGRLPCR